MGLRVAVDFDDVLNLFLKTTIEKLNFVYDLDVREEDIKGWNIEDYVDCSREDVYRIWTDEFVNRIPLKDDAVWFIRKLKELGHEVVIATACYSSIMEAREKFCVDILGIDREDVIFIKKKYLLDVDILIDDKIANFLCPDGIPIKPEKIVMDMPHNKKAGGLGKHYRAKDLKDALRIVKLIDRNKNKKRG